jgi:hypothetical protein
MTNLMKKLGFASLLAFGAVTSAQAMVLDTFDYSVTLETPLATSGSTISSAVLTGVTNTPIAGDVQYTLTATSDASFAPRAGTLPTGEMYLFNDDGTSNVTLEYSDANATSLLDITDAGASNSFYFDVEFIDLGFILDLTVMDFAGNSSVVNYEQLVAIPAADPTERVYISFNDFNALAVLGGGTGTEANFSQVVSITAVVSGSNTGADLKISEVGTSVPEPTTIALFGLALVGFAFNSKRKA